MLRKKISTCFVIFTIVFNLFPLHFVSASNLNPAIITNLNISNKKYPIIEITAFGNTEVLIYDNLKFQGLAQKIETINDQTKFFYKPNIALDEGIHVFKALARDKTSLLLSVFSNEVELKILSKKIETKNRLLPAPTLIEPNKHTVTAKVMPLIKGLTINNTKIQVYIDGVLNGGTNFLTHDSGTANFAYKPFLNLKVGQHVAWAVAIDKDGKISRPSNILSFKIEEKLPAPTLIDVIVQDGNKILVTGLVKNNLKVKIFIDYKLDKEFAVEAHSSGTANFHSLISKPLSLGTHVIYASVQDTRGKESDWSNIFYKTIAPVSDVSPIAVDEEVEVLSIENKDFQKVKELLVLARLLDDGEKIQVNSDDVISLNDIIARKNDLKLSEDEITALEKLLAESKREDTTIKNDTANNDVEEILNQENGDIGEKTGAINESKENQGKLKLNIIIFIFFLTAVIVWIFWVNRELIKERREQNEEDEKNKKN